MAFDPDAYLAQTASPAAPAAFDPDAYLQSTSTKSRASGKAIDRIPGTVRNPTISDTPERPESSFLGKLLSPVETAVSLGVNAITAPIVGGAKIYGTLTSGKFGTQQGIAAGEETGRKVQQFFQPSLSPEAEAQTQAIGNFLSRTGIEGVPLNVLGDLQRGMAPALRATADTARAPIAARAEKIQQARIDQSYANAPMIDAAQAAQRIGGAIPPAISNPTKTNVIKGKLVGPELETRLAKANETAVTDKVRKDLGIKPNEKLIPEVDDVTGKLNIDSPITRAIEEASKPYEVIRKMESLITPKESINALESLKKQAPIGGGAKTAALNSVVDDALAKLQQTTSGAFSGVGGGPVAVGRSGAAVLDDIRSLRRDAQAAYRAQKINPDPLAIAKADAQMSIANILEGVIDANAPTPKVLRELKEARSRIAQIYEHERAINYGQQKIDPQVYAKLYEERKGGMTGLNADIAKAASMFPDYFTLTPAEIKGLPRITRGGVGGAIGGALGVPLGPAGVVAGTAAGIGIGSAAGAVAARRMATPAYQRANAMPTDYRPVPLGTKPADINYGPNQVVPYDFSQQTFTPPNFVMRGGQADPRVSVQPVEMPTNALGYNPNVPSTAEVQMNRLRAEDVMDRNRAAGLDQQAQAQAEAAAAAARKPAGRGVDLVFDSAGNLVEAPVAGAGGGIGVPTALESAVAKIAGQMQAETSTKFSTRKTTGGKIVKTEDQFSDVFPGEAIISRTGPKYNTTGKVTVGESTREPSLFNLTAEERIAWNKTRADLAEVMPELKKLSDREITRRMADVKLSEEMVAKAREKAAMFDELSKRIAGDQAKRDAAVKREQMLDLLANLEDQFSKSRPVAKGAQGPKTRAAQRNMLIPEERRIILNNMLPNRD